MKKTSDNKVEYVQRIAYYRINLTEAYYFSWLDFIKDGKELPSEILGYLLGCAKPVFVKSLCVLCKKPIKIKDQFVRQPDEWKASDVSPIHKKCYEKANKGNK